MIQRSIKVIAGEARAAMERWSSAAEGEQLSRGRCKIVSSYLYWQLEAAGHAPRLISGVVHCDRPDARAPAFFAAAGHLDAAHWWVAVGELIVDVSADQFNPRLEGESFDAVIIAPRSELARHVPDAEGEPVTPIGREWERAFRDAPPDWP